MADPNVTERSFPFASGQGEEVTEDDWSAMAGTWQDNGVAFGLTVVPGPTQNTIQINEGQADIDGFVYRLTAPKVLTTLSNPNSTNRADLVVLRLDTTNEAILPAVRSNTPLSAVAVTEIPLYSWTQLPASTATSSNWGFSTDLRWYQGARMRPATAGAFPPPTIGGFLYVPASGGQGSVYIGALGTGGLPEWVEWAPGTDSVNALIATAVASRVSTAGGSTIAIPNGNTTTSALQVHIPAGDRSTAADTFGFYLNVGTDASPTWRRVTYINEKGAIRIIQPTDADVPFRVKAFSASATAALIDVTDINNVSLMSVSPNGTVVAPNVGGARVFSGASAPSSPKTGDVWVQF